MASLLLSGCQNQEAASSGDAGNADATSVSAGWPTQTVSDTGDIALPDGFLTWPTLGAWSTADGTGAQNGMHQVYASPGTIEGYQATGSFPDGSVLVKEVRGAATANLSTGAASYATEKQVWFVMVKDAENRFPDNALWGDGWGWALFEAADPSKQAASDYEVDCKGCHIPAEARDWIYAEAYPVLWPDGVAPPPTWQD
ncbi:MAG: cytochrome P460 family protein [Pseudomonadota bacterium]